MSPSPSFQPCFSSLTFDFLETLAANNSRDWFAGHKQDYEDKVRTPALSFIMSAGERLPHEAGKDVHAPGYYVHISAAECFVGIGIWHPPSEALANIRTAIVEQPQDWSEALHDTQFSRWFALSGNSLKTAPRGFDKTHPLLDDLKRKDFIAIAKLPPALIEQEDFSAICCDYFTVGAPFMRFLCTALRLPF